MLHFFQAITALICVKFTLDYNEGAIAFKKNIGRITKEPIRRNKKPKNLKKSMPSEGPMPIINEGEDEASHGRHLKVLALECRRTKQNNLAIKEVMARFQFIRTHIATSSGTL